MIRRRRNHIGAVKDENHWFTEKADIQSYFLKNFQTLFTSNYPFIPDGLEGVVQPLISDEENDLLVRVLEEDEIKAAVWDLHPLKSSGPDGFSGIFFRKYWGIEKRQSALSKNASR